MGGASAPSPGWAHRVLQVVHSIVTCVRQPYSPRAGHTTFLTVLEIPLTIILFQKASNGKVRGKKGDPRPVPPGEGAFPSRNYCFFLQASFPWSFRPRLRRPLSHPWPDRWEGLLISNRSDCAEGMWLVQSNEVFKSLPRERAGPP